ncbi:MAG TPA: hypothetical protein VM509_11290 [Planctomycetota bacterium]|nr:hypothetical protein [Planctomycetota bacterium]
MATRRIAASLGAGLALTLCACPSGLDRASTNTLNLPANENFGQGFEPGLAPTAALGDDAVICAGVIPGATPAQDLALAFFVFTTAASATDADGQGHPLVRETPPPVDTNGASDVFVAAVVRSANAGSTTPNAFTQAVLPVMRHPRCLTCHSFHYPGSFGTGGQHTGGNSFGANVGCLGCHNQNNIGSGQNGGAIDWRAPTVSQGDLDFRNKTAQQLFDMVMDNLGQPTQVVQHLKDDDRIFWALDLGIVPSNPPSNIGDVPITKVQWDGLVDAWAAGNFTFDTSGAVQDITLVSRRREPQFNQAGSGASFAPHAVYVPNVGYVPSNSSPQIAGRIHVVFASAATDFLTPAGLPSTRQDVWHATIEVRMNEDPQTGQAAPGDLNLLAKQSLLERVSHSAAAAPGNGDSDHPRIACDASKIVFDSEATNLVAGFGGPANSNVFIAAPGGNPTLVSHSAGAPATGGNGDSRNPSLSALSQAVVYETLATDVFASSPGNAVQNIAVSMPPAATATLASVDSAGIPGTGGACRRPSVFITDVGSPLVVFESDKLGLVSDAGVIAATQIYLNVDGTTRLLTRKGAAPGNGPSTRPALSLDGRTLVFQSTASNLDTIRPFDANGASDVLRCDVAGLLASGTTLIERLSIAPDGSDGDAASDRPLITDFVRTPLLFDGGTLGLYRTQATNVGAAVNTDAMFVFLVDPGP